MIPVNGKEYHLRKRSIVFIPTTLIHLDEEIYSNANQYQPERFLGADLESSHIITNEHTVVDEEKKPQNKSPKFFKKGIPVKHYLMPFGGGDNLVFALCPCNGLIIVYRSSICSKRSYYHGVYNLVFV